VVELLLLDDGVVDLRDAPEGTSFPQPADDTGSDGAVASRK
jgi:hypothetical protein